MQNYFVKLISLKYWEMIKEFVLNFFAFKLALVPNIYWRRGRESAQTIAVSDEKSMSYDNSTFIAKLTASLDVSRFFPLLPDVFHLRGHILGTKR